MKFKNLNLLLLLIILVVASCSKKEENFSEKGTTVNKTLVEKVLYTKNLDEQKSSYLLLNASEKSMLWSMKFDALLNKNVYSEEQSKFILKLKSTLSPALFEGNANKTRDKVDSLEPSLRKEGIDLFGHKQAYDIMASISPDDEFEPPLPKCTCSTTSDWCPKGSSKKNPAEKCTAGGCENKPGCGYLLIYDCNGECEAQQE